MNKIKTILFGALALAACGALVVAQAKQSRADEARLQRIEARLDSLTPRPQPQLMRFVMSDSSVVVGTWADVEFRVWDIRSADSYWVPGDPADDLVK